MTDEKPPETGKQPRKLRLGPFLFIGILFLGLGLTAIADWLHRSDLTAVIP